MDRRIDDGASSRCPCSSSSSLDGNRATIAEMIRLCLDEDAPRLLCRISARALTTQDFVAIEQAAHGLKGLVGEFPRRARVLCRGQAT